MRTPSPPSDPVARALTFDHFDDPDPDGAHRTSSKMLFDLAESALDNPKQVLPDSVDDEAELRGRIDGIPLRLILEGEGGWRVEAKVSDTYGGAGFLYDPDLLPIEADADDDFADEDEIRVFVAKGLYIEGDTGVVEVAMEFIEAIDPAEIEIIRAAMAALPLSQVWFGVEEVILYGAAPLRESADPVSVVRQTLELTGGLATRVIGGETKGALNQIRCEYCRVRYFHGLRRETCPNCGAPPGAGPPA